MKHCLTRSASNFSNGLTTTSYNLSNCEIDYITKITYKAGRAIKHKWSYNNVKRILLIFGDTNYIEIHFDLNLQIRRAKIKRIINKINGLSKL